MPHAPSRSHAATSLLPLLSAVLLIVSCGPMATDAGARYDYERNASYPVLAGEAVLVDVTLDLADLGLDQETVDARVGTWIPAGINGESANAAQLVFLDDVTLAPGWEARLWQVRVVRERPFSDPSAVRTYRIDATIRIDVPADAFELTRRLTGTLIARNAGDGYPVTFLIEGL